MKITPQFAHEQLNHCRSYDDLRVFEWLLQSNYHELDIELIGMYRQMCNSSTTNHRPKGDYFCLEGLYGRYSEKEVDKLMSNISNTIEQSNWEQSGNNGTSTPQSIKPLNTRQLRFGQSALYGALNSSLASKAISIVDFGGGGDC